MTHDCLTLHLQAGGLCGLQREFQRLVVDDQAFVSEVLVVQRYRCRPASPVQHRWEGFVAQYANCANCLVQLRIGDRRTALRWVQLHWVPVRCVALVAAALLVKPALRYWDQVMLQSYATSDPRGQQPERRDHLNPRAALRRWACERG
jgi:hypothetical protein